MRGIVGLLMEDPGKRNPPGEYGTKMPEGIATRDRDPAGLAAYTDPVHRWPELTGSRCLKVLEQ